MTTDTRHFHSGMAGAPVLNNTAGSLNALLRACLLAGFNQKTVDTLVVSSSVATATINSGHGFSPAAEYANVEGASVPQLNGVKKVLTVPNAQTFTYDATGVASQTAAGTITCERAAIGGWEESFVSGSASAWRSVHAQANGHYLSVDDTTVGESCVVRGYETMTGATTGANPFPTVTQATTCYFGKGANSVTAKNWALVGDPRRFYFFLQASSGGAYVMMFFGDTNSLRPGGDLFSTLLMASPAATGGYWTHVINPTGSTSPITTHAMPRPSSGAGTPTLLAPIQGFASAPSSTGNPQVIGDGSDYPDAVVGGTLVYGPLMIRQGAPVGSTSPFRSTMPGLLQPLSRVGQVLPSLSILAMDDAVTYPSGLLAIAAPSSAGPVNHTSATAYGAWLFDLDNAW